MEHTKPEGEQVKVEKGTDGKGALREDLREHFEEMERSKARMKVLFERLRAANREIEVRSRSGRRLI